MIDTHKVLVVDDDDDIRESLVDFLLDHGYEAIGAADGLEALRTLRRPNVEPCLILLDLMMPRMDGRTFREQQLRDPALSTIPVIVISAFRDLATEDLSVSACMEKPLNLDALLSKMREHCAPS